jgi:hypothetical protein
MKFEWDHTNRQINLGKHGIDFVGCEVIFDGPTKTVIDHREDHGEERFVTFGLLEVVWSLSFMPKPPIRFG